MRTRSRIPLLIIGLLSAVILLLLRGWNSEGARKLKYGLIADGIYKLRSLVIKLPKETNYNYKRRNERIREKFSSRINQISQTCSSSRSDESVSDEERLRMINLEPRKKMAWCRTAKHGSTTLSNVFLQLYTLAKNPPGTQLELRDIEEAVYPGPRKLDIIKTLESEDHDYLSIAVCRNPVEKLLSVYHVMQDPKAVNPDKYPSRSDFFSPRTWPEYLDLVAKSDDLNYLGLLYPFHLRCRICTFNYDAIIKMETYEEDIRSILNANGTPWISVPHYNIHGNNRLGGNSTRLKEMFEDVSEETMNVIIDRYKQDFILCGYSDTLQILDNILKHKKDIKNVLF